MSMVAQGQGGVAERRARCGKCGLGWGVVEAAWGAGMSCPGCGTPVAPMALVGHYQMVRAVASGGLGTVYEGVDSITGRAVAVKVLRDELSADTRLVGEFRGEAMLAGGLHHPNVVEVYDFIEEAGRCYLVMEFLAHGSLAERIKPGPLPEAEILKIAEDLVRGLQAASMVGLLHRDIKPANVVFDGHGRARLVDFGLSMRAEEALVARGQPWGSPFYIPPERLDGAPEDVRSDMYSLGATLFHAAAGRPLFEGRTATALVRKHLKARHAPVRALASHLSAETGAIIDRCLARRPHDRFESYFELMDAIEAARRKLAAGAGIVHSARERAVPDIIGAGRERSLTFWIIGVGALGLALLGAGLWMFVGDRDKDPLGVEKTAGGPPIKVDAALANTPATLGAPEATVPSGQTIIVRFTEAEGYHEGALDHRDWAILHPGWAVPPGGGSLVRPVGWERTSSVARFLQRPIIRPGVAVRGRVRYRFAGKGSAIAPGEILRLTIWGAGFKFRKRPESGQYELSAFRTNGARGDVLASAEILAGEVIEASEAIDGTQGGSAILDLSWILRRDARPSWWHATAELRNVSQGRTLAQIASEAFEPIDPPPPDDRYESRIGVMGFPGRVDVFEWEVCSPEFSPGM